jgi:ornithine cyclodeaminase/alanine dehydrogenase-like protein (mu-crystallin family)
MTLLVLSAAAVREVLSYPDCVASVRWALSARARGEAYQPLRAVLQPPGAAGLMALMPCYLPPPAGAPDGAVDPASPASPGEPAYGLKALCVTPANAALGKDAHQGGVLISSAGTGEPLALLNASALTEIRTAAVSALATEALARPGASELAIIGTGVQARAHARAMAASRPLSAVRVAGRDPERARRFADDLGPVVSVPVVGCGSVADALDGADIVVTATTAQEPVLRRGWLAAGAHVNAVGACVPGAREIDGPTMAEASVFVDSRESAANESGDVLLAMADGAIGADHIKAELGEVITGMARGRTGDAEITLFESLGLAVEDLAAAAHAYREACRLGVGAQVDF